MKPNNETLMAYIDGELSEQEAARVALALAADPALAEQVEQQRRLRARLEDTYAPVLEEAVPERLWAAAGLPGAGPRAKRPEHRRWSWPEWTAVAAALVMGVFLAQMLSVPSPTTQFIESAEGLLLAHDDLERSLERDVSGPTQRAGGIAIAFSFLDREGRPCRTFAMGSEVVTAGLACRHADGWRLSMLVDAPQAPQGEVRMASSALPPALLREVDARISGEPLDRREEVLAIESGWR